MTIHVEGQAEFTSFKGSIYKIPVGRLSKGYDPDIVNGQFIKNIELEALNIPKSDDGMNAFGNVFGIPQHAGYGIIFMSQLKVEESGCYELSLKSDDGSILWIDDYKVIDNDLPHGMRLKTDTVALLNRAYDIKVWYYNAYPTLYGLILNQKKIDSLNSCDTLGQTELNFSLLSDILFETDKYEIRNDVIAKLDSIAEVIQNEKFDTLEIIGRFRHRAGARATA